MPKIDNATDVMLHSSLRYLHNRRVRTSRTAHDKRNIDLWRVTSEVAHLWTYGKLIFSSEIPTLLFTNKNFQQNLLIFSVAIYSD